MPREALARRRQLNMRVTELTRTKLEVIAGGNGRSITQEVEHLIDQAADQHEQLGGPAGRRVVYAMGSSLLIAGQFSAGEGVPVERWLQDRAVVITAIASAVDALTRTLPCLGDDDALRQLTAAIHGRLATRAAQRGSK